MVRAERFHNSLIRLVILLFFIGCSSNENGVFLTEDHPNLEKKKGVYYYQNSPLNGTVYTLFSSGDTLSVFTYEKGKKHGVGKKWWPNGQLKFKGNYESGIYQGEVAEWHGNGTPYALFHYNKGKESGKQTAWEPNGDIKANYEVIGDRKYGLTGVKNCSNVWEDE